MIKECLQCGEEYEAKRKDAKWCSSACAQRNFYQRHPGKQRQYDKQRTRTGRSRHLWETYRLTIEDYNQMFADQQGCCDICGIHQSETKRFHVDHCHTTGQVRGLLCCDCNIGLGRFKDDTETLANAIVYLQRSN